jgi:hypothetical protein
LYDNFVTKILILGGGYYLTGSYGGGIAKPVNPYKLLDRKPKSQRNKPKIFSVAQNNFPKLPSKIKPPTIEELNLMQTKLEKLIRPLPKVYAAYLGEDWKTQGDWVGRTFRDWAVMCAAVSPFDRDISFSDNYYEVHDFIGPNADKSDSIRAWVHWLKTDNPKALWDPFVGYRRQAEWDDHGEAYPLFRDGPDIWYQLDVKHTGVFKIGMYFFNKDGHHGMNRLRDYIVEVYPSENHQWQNYIVSRQIFARIAESQVTKLKPLLRCRINNFWGGVHKQFVINGPAKYFVKIDRNYSFNTIISAVTIDRLHGKPTWDESLGIPFLAQYPYEPPEIPKCFENNLARRAVILWSQLDGSYDKLGNIEKQRESRIVALRGALSVVHDGVEEEKLARSLKWRLNFWDKEQREEWQLAMKHAWQKLCNENPGIQISIKKNEKK